CCTATDAHGKSARCTFHVRVVDTTPPTLSYAPHVYAECTGTLTIVTFSVTASDLCDASPSIQCVPPSGSEFPRGRSTVTCTATAVSGTSANGDFDVPAGGSPSSPLQTAVVGQPASALVYPLFDSTRGRGTIITVTNTDTSTRLCSNRQREGDVCVHY